ncbi:hypothetical protein SLA2020_205520 [Shorea laevis]
MSQKQGKKESKLSKCLKLPIRILTRARDFYIKSITECSDWIGHGTTMACPTGHLNTLPRSFSVSSTKSTTGDEDLRELIRAASIRSLGNKIQADLLQQQQGRQSTDTAPYIVLRSQSIGIGRIDEDKPCEFGEDIKVQTTILPRSLSYAAVGKRKGTVL